MKIYNKLVRDNIPQIIKDGGSKAKTRILEDEEYLKSLAHKLIEEAHEVKETPSKEELADVLEVVMTFADALGISMSEIEKERQRKAKSNGGFKKRIFLESVD